jgi:hypothetical protein
MRLTLTAVTLLALAGSLPAAPAPPGGKGEAKQEAKAGAWEVDFAPTPELVKYDLRVVIQSGEELFDETFHFDGMNRRQMRGALLRALGQAEWAARQGGDAKLAIEGYNGKGVASVQITALGLGVKEEPKARRLPGGKGEAPAKKK